MKVLILADANSIHTRRWVKSLSESGISIKVVTMSHRQDSFYENINVNCVYMNKIKVNDTYYKKLTVLTTIKKIRIELKNFNPDIVHAHYASSYGLLGALLGFRPYIVSVWGSDVYDFPKQNILSAFVLRYVLHKADKILSTSYVMAKETAKYTNKEIQVTPFGVDTNFFKSLPDVQDNNEFIIGTVKTLAPKYGIDYLIKAFAITKNNNPNLNIKLKIYGEGSSKQEYEKLVAELKVEDTVEFGGYVINSELPKIYNQFNVAVFLSVLNSESFGVAAVEAMSCECPVIVSDADGFTEVVKDGQTGFIVPKRDARAAAEAIQKYIDNEDLMRTMGLNARKRVLSLYDWSDNVELMVNYYKSILGTHKNISR